MCQIALTIPQFGLSPKQRTETFVGNLFDRVTGFIYHCILGSITNFFGHLTGRIIVIRLLFSSNLSTANHAVLIV
jgi:hypothetical protein